MQPMAMLARGEAVGKRFTGTTSPPRTQVRAVFKVRAVHDSEAGPGALGGESAI